METQLNVLVHNHKIFLQMATALGTVGWEGIYFNFCIILPEIIDNYPLS